ncbi:NEAT domain-containing protein [Sporosarcina sp. FSL W8-0480]|uniref:NEAT domain-containing protein n=1 Tax=Sporosarcina sp. FSL W8-0480 TaxID=2954701 RepID=UPI0030DCF591
MKKNLMMLLTAILVLFTAVPALPSAAAEVNAQEQQTYELPFKVLKADSDEVSAAGQHVKSPAQVKVENGKNIVYMTLLNSQYWQSMKIQDGTDFVAVEVVSEDEEAKTRLVKFEIKDVKKILSAKAHIIVTGIPGMGTYDTVHDIRFQFEGSNVPADKEDESKGEETGKPVTVKDGNYTIDFTPLHEKEDKASSMARHMETTAALTVKDGKNLVTVKLTNNEQVTAFQVEQNGEFVDAKVEAVDEEANSRTVSFEVANLSEIMNAKVTVHVASANYTGNHVVRLSFDTKTIAPVAAEKAPVSFKDINNSFAKEYIVALAEKEILKGKTSDTFAPDDKITRAQFAMVIARALELPKQEATGTFSDVTKDMKTIVQEIEAANRAGIVLGKNDGKFSPNEEITREQMAAMIIRAIEYKNASVLKGIKTDVVFSDAGRINAYAKTAVAQASGLGIIDGSTVDGKKVFQPKDSATRAHASKMVYNMLEVIK